jgi:hypothetical protein
MRSSKPHSAAQGQDEVGMSKVLVLTLLLTVFVSISFAQSIAGIRVGDNVSVLDKLNLKPTAREHLGSTDTVKYKLANGNDLSVSYGSPAGRIVYVECDWNRSPEGANTDFPDFKFGVTTLEEIRIANGSNGFSYRSNAMNTANGQLFTFNAYSIKDKPGLVAVFVTALNIAELHRRRDNTEPTAADMAKNLTLDAIIFAEETYLDGIWGKEKIYDKEAKPIVFAAIDAAAEDGPRSKSR